MMRRLAILALLVAPLPACTALDANHVTLTIDAGYASTEAAFVAFQNAAIAGIRNGTITGATKARVLDLLAQGQTINNRLYATRSAADIVLLSGIVSQLTALGIKGN
jgi:hypothetical protein